MGELSDIYDTCSKVSEKREIARLVVEAVYENGGRFLDADGNDIGYKRSMDKAMKALKDRRHIKSRKLIKPNSNSHSAQAIKKEVTKKRAEVFPTAAAAAKKSSPKAPKRLKDPLTTDDAGHALLLLRNAAEEVDRSESEDEQRRLPPNKRKPFLEGQERHFPLASALRKTLERQDNYRGYRQYNEPILEDRFRIPRRRSSEQSQGSSYAARRTPDLRSTTPSTQPLSPQVQVFAKPPPTSAKQPEQRKEKPKEGNGGMPVLWQSVIVSRERPQASLADMLVNAKQRLDALSSIQQAVSAPICLIYPPSHGVGLQASQVSAYPAQVSMGQIPLGSQVQLTQYPLRQEFFQGASRSGVLGSGL